MTRALAAAVSALAVLLVSAAAIADEIRVPGDHRRLADALAAARPGDTVAIESGTHRGPFVVRTPDIVLEGRGGRIVQGARARRSRDPSADAVVVVTADRVTLRGLAISRGGIRAEGSGVVVEGCALDRCDDRRHVAIGVELAGDGARVRISSLVGGRGLLQGIRISGRDAVVERVDLSGTRGGPAVEVLGDGARVLGTAVHGIELGDGIRIEGDGARVESSEVDAGPSGGAAVVVEGGDAVVQDNRLDAGPEGGVVVRGDRASVVRNDLASGDEGTAWVEVEGDDARVSENDFDRGESDGIVVRGDRATLEGNGDPWCPHPGGRIVVEGEDALLVGNAADPSDGNGIVVRGDRARLHGNSVGWPRAGNAGILVEGSDGLLTDSDACAGQGSAIVVRGDRHRIESNGVRGTGFWDAPERLGHGIVVRGSGNLLLLNRVERAPADGIRLVTGLGNLVDACSARDSGACGVLNLATDTGITGSVFLDSAVDVFNGESITVFDGNEFRSGSPDRMPFGGSAAPEEDFGIERTGTWELLAD